MKAVESRLYFSATDLSNFLGCSHLALLDQAVRRGEIGKPPKFDDPGLEVLKRRGDEHEREYLRRLRSEGRCIAEVPDPPGGLPYQERWARHAAATLEAMKSGADVVYQAALQEGAWVGKADFLVRVEVPSDLGPWSYEVVDTKLAREAKGGALLQVLLYADLLARTQGVMPERVHLALGGPERREESFRVADYAAYYRSIRDRFVAHVNGGAKADLQVAPDPVAHCDICAWRMRCAGERREVDHLSLVADIRGRQRDALRARGVDTLASLATLEVPVRPRLEGVSDASLLRVREQARIQAEGRAASEAAGEERVLHELLEPVVAGEGLGALPAPSPGDMFFDIEGDSFAFDHGLEYLFGWTDREGRYESLRALERAEEKVLFERFIDTVMARWADDPHMHVYHYAPYEPTALKKLMGLHGTREEEVDRLLRGGVLVDLYRVVRQGLRASVESYSIKRLEPLYGYARNVDLPEASRALATFEAILELGQADLTDPETAALLDRITGYNRDDCVSTLRLRDWLELQREGLERRTGWPVPRPGPEDAAPSETLAEGEEEVARLVARLTAGVPADEAERSPEAHGRWLLAQTLGFHRREDKSTWWEYYHRCNDLDEEDRMEDRSTLGMLEHLGEIGQEKQSVIHRFRFPPQDHEIEVGSRPHDAATRSSAGTVVALDERARTIDLKWSKRKDGAPPTSLVPLDRVPDKDLRLSLRRLAAAVLDEGLGDDTSRRSAADLLLRRPPRCGQGRRDSLAEDGEPSLEAACRLAECLDRSVLAIQGPPGSGKTYTGARMIVRLLAAGKRVGVTATSHKVITNLLDAVCKAADEAGYALRGVQKPSKSGRSACTDERIAKAGNEELLEALEAGTATLAAGTSWLWSREDAAGAVDVLFVDEAGQFSLANALAVSQAADSLVLLGDPAQLQQPQQGSHPPGSEASALEHLLAGATTMPPDRGLFLARTWRLHPDICDFTSEIYYAGRLRPKEGEGMDEQRLGGADELKGAGLRYVPVSHEGNQNESAEEAEAVRALMEQLLRDGRTWTDRKGSEATLRLKDILVVAPYNAQVSAITDVLPDGARVGTVDRFQGQEAPVVIYSMASSTPEDAPRGMTFLYDPHRLNVATSRARCAAIIVASPELFAPSCRTLEQMRLANGLCRFLEMAEIH